MAIQEEVLFRDLGVMDYQAAWEYQEQLLRENVQKKTAAFAPAPGAPGIPVITATETGTRHYLLFVEHPPVYTLGKSGKAEHVLLDESGLEERGIQFFSTNRGGDITYHGPGQVVGYPVLDLEKFSTDIGKYLRNLEEVIIRTLADYGITGERSPGETGVWIEPGLPGRERKICAIGVRCSRWITMHGFAVNVNTDLSYFNHIIPCGIVGKQVTSLEKETGAPQDIMAFKEKVRNHFEAVFDAVLVQEPS